MHDLITDLALLYKYPGPEYRAIVAEATELAAQGGDDTYVPMRRFFDWVATQQRSGLEETFTQTFDLNPTCNPEIGWHIWGEDYNRGAFMADLRDRFEEYGVEENGELPDHITHMLPLLVAMEGEPAAELARKQILPALLAMEKQLHSEKSPFGELLSTTVAAVRNHTGVTEDIDLPVKLDKTIPMDLGTPQKMEFNKKVPMDFKKGIGRG